MTVWIVLFCAQIMSKRSPRNNADPSHCKRHKADIDALVHLPNAENPTDTLLRELTERTSRLEQEKAEYQAIAGRASQELANIRGRLVTKTSAACELIARGEQQVQEMHEENGRIKRALAKTKKDHESLQQMSLHEFMSRKSTCPVCMEDKRLCVIIPCFHTCCQRCVIRCGQGLPRDKPLECPTCRQHVVLTHDFETGLWHHDRP